MVGNDIVDIAQTKCSTNWERPGFIQKVFTAEEQSYIEASTDKFCTVWRLWSMKESAYKVFIQVGAHRFFNPTLLQCYINNSSKTGDFKKGKVQIGDMLLRTSTSLNSKYIFTTASIANSSVLTSIQILEGTTPKQQSNFMHEQLLDAVAREKSLNREALCLIKNQNGVPTLVHENTHLKNSVSITHHGSYGAYSFVSD